MNGATVPSADPVEQRLIAEGRAIRKIFLHDLALNIHMGVHVSEKGRPQRVLVNVTLYLAAETRPQRDSIKEVFDYDQVRDAIHRLVDDRHINLQETLVDEIVDLCLGFDVVVAARVSSEKTDVYPDCAGVGCEVVRFRDA